MLVFKRFFFYNEKLNLLKMIVIYILLLGNDNYYIGRLKTVIVFKLYSLGLMSQGCKKACKLFVLNGND